MMMRTRPESGSSIRKSPSQNGDLVPSSWKLTFIRPFVEYTAAVAHREGSCNRHKCIIKAWKHSCKRLSLSGCLWACETEVFFPSVIDSLDL